MEKIDYVEKIIREMFNFSDSPINIITVLIFCFSLIISYFVLKLIISCSKKNNRAIYLLPIHLITLNLPSYFLKLGIMQILSLSAPIMPFISYFFYCSYKAIFFSLLFLLLSGFMSLTFSPEIILLLNTYYCIVFIFEIIIDYFILMFFLINMTFLIIFLREVKICFEYATLLIIALRSRKKLLKDLKNQINLYKDYIINIDAYKYKIYKLKSFIIFTFIYSLLRIIIAIFLVYFLSQMYFQKNIQILVCENLFSTISFSYDALFLFIFLIMIFPEKYPDGYLDEVILFKNIKECFYKSNLKNEINLLNINKENLLEYKNNIKPITILLPYSKHSFSSFNSIKLGFVE
jgi:hypothetical protein